MAGKKVGNPKSDRGNSCFFADVTAGGKRAKIGSGPLSPNSPRLFI
jgi:hypothetical protein